MSAFHRIVLGFGLTLLTACGADPAAPPSEVSPSLRPFLGLEGNLDVAGGTAHIPVMKEAAKRIMTANPNVRITVAGGGSGVGIQKAGEGLVQIGNAGRPLSDDERAKFGLVSIPFAVDGVAVIVHPTRTIRDLTAQQVKDVFAGKVADWSELGGAPGAINLYGRDEASGTRSVFWKKALGKGEVAGSTNIVTSNGAMKTAISNDPRGIGYLSIGHVDAKVAAVAIDGIAPSQENAQSGAYEVTRKLFMNTKGEPGGLARVFIGYILSEDGAAIIRDCGYLPLGFAERS